MAEYILPVNDAKAVQLWQMRAAREALKMAYATRFIGTSPNSLIHLKTQTKQGPGESVTCQLVMTPTGDGVTEGGTLEGNEEAPLIYSDKIMINKLRHALRAENIMNPQRLPFSLREEMRVGLSKWHAERIDTSFFNQICGFTAQTDVKYTGLNAVVAPTSTRRLYTSGSNDESVNNATAYTFNTVGYIENMVTLARTVTPMIEPIRVDGREKYILFLHDYQVRDLRKAKSSTEVTWWDAQQALVSGGYLDRKKISTIYQGAIGEWNDVIIHRSSRVTNGVHSTSGVAQTSTRRAVLCGAQAAIAAFGKGYSKDRFRWTEESFDYEDAVGFACTNVFGLKKSVFNSTDFGAVVLTSYAAAS